MNGKKSTIMSVVAAAAAIPVALTVATPGANAAPVDHGAQMVRYLPSWEQPIAPVAAAANEIHDGTATPPPFGPANMKPNPTPEDMEHAYAARGAAIGFGVGAATGAVVGGAAATLPGAIVGAFTVGSAGGLYGAVVGTGIGCFVGLPFLLVGCIPGALIGGAIGGAVGSTVGAGLGALTGAAASAPVAVPLGAAAGAAVGGGIGAAVGALAGMTLGAADEHANEWLQPTAATSSTDADAAPVTTVAAQVLDAAPTAIAEALPSQIGDQVMNGVQMAADLLGLPQPVA
ncbi:hypothetical protein [Nocardia sp. CDC160]|uniref:hypothetical protein n=1 Tax=Nocardia sp. CDC160 TaxID=3112166 RepID=UPI002DBC4305|nr:hypothetical protein [Nocardia sp. CDC160]MEC3916415.1 hypothetical protein [Nocardia sp. CDC160]